MSATSPIATKFCIAAKRRDVHNSGHGLGRLLDLLPDASTAARQSYGEVRRRLAGLNSLRSKVDGTSTLDPELVAAWFPAANALIAEAQKARMTVERDLPRNLPGNVRALFELKGLLAVISEAAGRERGGVAGATPTGRQRPAVTNLATMHYDSLVPREWFGKVSMQRINVLSIQRISAEDRAKIEAVDPAIELTDAGGWYDGEIRETWPAVTTARYLAPGATGSGTREERDRLLAEAEVILGGWPFPLDLRARAPRLKWFHQRPAGASNLLVGDLWGSRVVVTTSRGSGNTLAMAEYAVAGILHFAKGLHRAAVDRGAGVFDHRAYRPLLLEGKTACVVGAGGIGLDVGKLCAALGMRVVGTRRHPHPDRPLPPGFSELGGAGDLDRFLPESDFVVICCQWTPETTRLFDKDRFAAMKAGGVLINVARGEIVDEEALADALQRDHLRGAALDVYVGEFEHTPTSRLWSDPRVLITPHISSASDQDRHGAINLFCDNLRAYLEGGPLQNVIDWQRGY
jgi:phosphoglycerate dehydrogenase-like enzyme